MKDPSVDHSREDNGLVGSTTSSLLERARKQTPGAWERLTALYGPLVYGWTRRAGCQAEDAADVVQEVFRAVVIHLGGFRRERLGDSFRGWLWTITQNKIRDLRRRHAGQAEAAGGTDAHHRLLLVPDALASGSGDSADSGDSAPSRPGSLLSRALELIRSEFEDRTWQAFWGVVAEDRSPADVSVALGLSVNAVYVARSRILRRLREELDDPPS
jgi:RNA polymerase sigma-70 factor, ECF subfamily